MDHDIRTIATCSPDTVRYKECCKNGALKYYMSCWTLAELKTVGNHIAENNPSLKEFMSPQAIEERYKRFGGIMRYVISNSKDADKSWRIAQDEAIKKTMIYFCRMWILKKWIIRKITSATLFYVTMLNRQNFGSSI